MNNTDFRSRYGVTISVENFTELTRHVKETLLSSKNLKVTELADDLANSLYPLSFLYLEVITPVLMEITAEWERGPRHFDQVHAAWSMIGLLLQELSHRRFTGMRLNKPLMLICCVENNFHELGVRMLADILREAGYPTNYFSPPTERDSILDLVAASEPACVGLSVSMIEQFDELFATIHTLRQRGYAGKIAAGGYAATRMIPEHWQQRGLDWIGTDPLAFIAWLDAQLAAGAEREAA